MRRALALLSCATALGLVTATRTASADEPRLEIDLTAGLVRRNGLGGDPKVSPDDPVQPETGGAPPTFSSSTRNGGLGGAVTVLFRSRYFLSPLVDLAYYPLSSTDRVLDLGLAPSAS